MKLEDDAFVAHGPGPSAIRRAQYTEFTCRFASD